MDVFVDVLRGLLAFTFVALGGLSIFQWQRRRGSEAAWLAGVFTVLGVVAAVDLIIARLPASPAVELTQRGYVSVLGLYPYFLYRFTGTFGRPPTWMNRIAVLLTAGTVIGALLLEPPPVGSSERPPEFQIFIVLLGLQWVTLSAVAGVRLWRPGRNQPTVARRRMRTMSLGSGLLSVTIVLAGLPAATGTAWGILFRLIALASGPMFLLAFSPPQVVLMLWRRKEEAALRGVQLDLVKALSQVEIAKSLLPKVASITGASGAALLAGDLATISAHEFSESQLDSLRLELPDLSLPYRPTRVNENYALRLEVGWLVLSTSSYTPFFGEEELKMLQGLAVMADLALARARLFELQTQATEAMQDFVAIASHDLRTPVTVIQGLSESMEIRWAGFTDEQKLEFIRAINRQTHHLNRLIDDLLTVSSLDVGEVEPQKIPTDLAQLAREMAKQLIPTTDVNVEARETAWAMVDPDHAERMLQNYLKNAVVYGEPPIEIEVVTEGPSIIVRVRDSGVGVPEEFGPRLFEKFARADKKKSRATQGTGLGLSIVKGLAEANGGEAWYEPNTPRGACFAVKLPSAQAFEESRSAE